MMHQFIRSLFIAGTLGWLFGGCSEKIEPKPATYSQLLTGTEKKAWKLVSLQVIDDGQKSGVFPISTQVKPCEADDQYMFYANEEHKFEYTNGPTKCDPTEQDVILEDTWSLVNANATLTFVLPFFNSSALPYKIKNLTATVMTVELYFDQLTSNNLNASYQFTFNSVTK